MLFRSCGGTFEDDRGFISSRFDPAAVKSEPECGGIFSVDSQYLAHRQIGKCIVETSAVIGIVRDRSYERLFVKSCLQKNRKKVDNQRKMIQKGVLLSCSYSRSVMLLPGSDA